MCYEKSVGHFFCKTQTDGETSQFAVRDAHGVLEYREEKWQKSGSEARGVRLYLLHCCLAEPAAALFVVGRACLYRRRVAHGEGGALEKA